MKKEPVEYWEKWGGYEREAMRAIVNDFNESQSQFEVVMKDAGDWSSSPDLPKFLAAQKEGSPPDLIGLEDHQIPDLASCGAIQPLPQIAHLSQCQDVFISLGAYGRVMYAAPVCVDVVTLFINLDAVRGTPFEGGHLLATLEEFNLELVGFDAHGRVGFLPSYPGWWPQVWAKFFGGKWVDESGRFTPELCENLRAFQWVREIRDRLWAGSDPAAWVPENVKPLLSSPVNPVGALGDDPFLSGQVGMVLDGDWLVKRLVAVPEVKWQPVGFPGLSGRPTCMVVGDLVAVPSGAKNPEGAMKFLQFMTQPDQIEKLAVGQGKVSPLREWSRGFLKNHPNPKIRDFRDLLSSAELFSDPRVPGWLQRLEVIKAAFSKVWLGHASPREALAAVMRETSTSSSTSGKTQRC